MPKLRSLALLASLALVPAARAPAESAAAPAAAVAPADSAAKAEQAAMAAAAEKHPAGKVVARLHETLLGVMKEAKTLGYEGRYKRLSPVIHDLFDLPFMAEKSVGRHWKTASVPNQRAFVDTFSRFTVANFAGRFDGFSGQSFRTLEVETSTHDTVLVRTRLDEPNEEGVALDYRLHQVGGGWRVVDIYLNGTVSELALRRSEYSALIQREGFPALLEKLDERIQDLAQAKAPQS